MVKISDIDFPVVFKNRLLFKAGNWNGLNISNFEVNQIPTNTKWDKVNSSLIYAHKDTNPVTKRPTEDITQAWAGSVKNVHSDGYGRVFGDVYVSHTDAALALLNDAPFAISAGIQWPEQYENPQKIEFRNFALVSNPGVRDKEIFFNFEADKHENGMRIANFAMELSSENTEGSELEHNTNQKTVVGKNKKKKKTKNYEEEDDDEVEMSKKELLEEHKKLVKILREGTPEERMKEADEQEKEMANYECSGKKSMNYEEDEEDEEDEDEDEDEDEKEDKKEEKKTENMSAKPDEKQEETEQETTVKKEDVKELSDESKEVDEEVKDQHAKEGINESKATIAAMNDVIAKKDWTMKDMNEPKDGDYTQTFERRLDKTMNNLGKTEDVSKGFNMDSAKIHNFEADAAVAQAPVASEAPKQETQAAPAPVNNVPAQPAQSYNTANPAMDSNFADTVADKLAAKLAPTLKPAPMTVNEFGSQAQDPYEDAVQKLTNFFVK